MHLREALDKSELMLDIASLVPRDFLGPIPRVSTMTGKASTIDGKTL